MSQAIKLPKKQITCKTCTHSHPIKGGRGQPMMECLRYPPTLHIVMAQTKLVGGPPQVMKQSGFPNCEVPCGEYKHQGELQ